MEDNKKFQVIVKQNKKYGETVVFNCDSMGQAIGMFQVLSNANESNTEVHLVSWIEEEESEEE